MPLEAGSGTNPSWFPDALVGKVSCKPSDRLRSSGLHILRHSHGCYYTRGPVKGILNLLPLVGPHRTFGSSGPCRFPPGPQCSVLSRTRTAPNPLARPSRSQRHSSPWRLVHWKRALCFVTAESRDRHPCWMPVAVSLLSPLPRLSGKPFPGSHLPTWHSHWFLLFFGKQS